MLKYITNYNRLLLLFLFSTALLFTMSCEKMIEVDLPNDRMNREDVYRDIQTTKSALNYLYSRIRDTPIFNFSAQGISYNLSLYTDDLDYFGNGTMPIYLNNIDATNLGITSNWWDNSYKEIYAINAFIEGVQSSSSLKELDKKQLLGEAYTLRALYYQILAKLYGNIPYTISTNYITNTTISKTDYSAVLEQIEKDLLLSIELLDYTYRNSERIYINKAVTELLLAENYLLQKRYDKAEIYAKNIIDNSIFQIEDDLSRVFLKDAKSTILQISPRVLPSTTLQASLYLYTTLTNAVGIKTEHYNSYDSMDKRKSEWITIFMSGDTSYYQVAKYKNKQNNMNEYGVFYRLEEAYFYLAEALAYQDKISDATKVLNIVRAKRGIADIPSNLSVDNFIDELLRESHKEFFSEGGHRFFDLKRNGRIQQLSSNKPTWQTFHDLFPIPEQQILMNRNLLPNNPGY